MISGGQGMRVERDSMGELPVPSDAYYGASTERAVRNFPISGQRLPRRLIGAIGLVKGAAVRVNADLGLFAGVLNQDALQAVATACEEVAAGRFDADFPVDIFQTGSGTSRIGRAHV